jgi:hypothetical protein
VPDAGGRGVAVAAFGLTLAGLAVAYRGLSGASPITWTYSQEEIDRASEGRMIVAAGAGILVGAAALVAAPPRLGARPSAVSRNLDGSQRRSRH